MSENDSTAGKNALAKLLSLRKTAAPVLDGGKLDDIQPTPLELALMPLYRFIGDEGATSLLQKCTSTQELLEKLTMVIAKVRKVKDWKAEVPNMKKMLKFKEHEIDSYSKIFTYTKMYVTPFTVESLMKNIPNSKVSEVDEQGRWVVQIATHDIPLRLNPKESFYEDCTKVFTIANRMSNTVEYSVAPYNMDYITMSLVLYGRLNIGIVNGIVKAKVRELPIHSDTQVADSDLLVAAEMIAAEVTEAINWSHWYRDLRDPIGIIYANYANTKFSDELQAKIDLYLSAGRDQGVTMLKYVDIPSRGEMANALFEYQRGADNLFAEAKSALDTSRTWREQVLQADRFTHDLCTDFSGIHFSEKEWGALQRMQLFSSAAELLGTKPISVFLRGTGADRIACALNLATKYQWTKYKEIPNKHYHNTSKLAAVEGWIENDPKDFAHPTIVMHFSAEYRSDIISAIEQEYEKVKHTNYVITIDHNLSEFESFQDVIKWCEAKALYVQIRRHPRKHNDAFSWQITNSKKYSDECYNACVRERIKMELQIIKNNAWRNEVIATGFVKFNYQRSHAWDMAMATTIAVTQRFSTLGKRAEKARLKDISFMKSQLKILEDEAREAREVAPPLGRPQQTAQRETRFRTEQEERAFNNNNSNANVATSVGTFTITEEEPVPMDASKEKRKARE